MLLWKRDQLKKQGQLIILNFFVVAYDEMM